MNGSEAQDPAVQHNLGLALYFQYRFDEARALFAAASANGLMAPSNFAYLARSRHHVGAMDEAIDACKRWVAATPSATGKSFWHCCIGADVAQSFVLAAQCKQQAASDVFASMLKQSPQAGVLPLIERLRIYIAKTRTNRSCAPCAK